MTCFRKNVLALIAMMLAGGTAVTLHKGQGLLRFGGSKTAAVFSPYHLTPGGGEKYLLSTVRAMQTLGYHVDILVQPDNCCQAKQCVMEVAASLRVTLDPQAFDVHTVHREDTKVYAGPYDLFFAMGNEKYPPVFGVGTVNLFMCQFPFDLDRVVPQSANDVFGSYDVVMLNSHYSLRWYHDYSIPLYHSLHGSQRLFPRMQVVHPPVTIVHQDQSHGRPRGAHVNIVMVGRFFVGRQSKGHPQAVKIFAELLPSLPKTTKLIMVGNPMPGHTAYVDDLHSLIKSLGLTDRVEIVLAAPPERVISILQSGLVQWHLTGLGVQNDPASFEHFGISIVEGMSMGCIPVAFTGGAADIIHHGRDGYVASSANKVVQHTKEIFSMTAREQQEMQARGVEKSYHFEYEKFEETFHDLVITTGKIKPITSLTKDMVKALRS